MLNHTITLRENNVRTVSRLTNTPEAELRDLLRSSSEYEIAAGMVKVMLPTPQNFMDGTINQPVQSRYFITSPKGRRQ